MKNKLFLIMFVAIISIYMVQALPVGPASEISVIASERYPTWASHNASAVAGNVTEFNLDSSTITRGWQGYFGNITGMIVLGDSNNNTLYDWELANPQGEVYAVRTPTVPSWYTVRCSNMTEMQDEDTTLNFNEAIDEDSVNLTFVVNGSAEQIANNGGTYISHPLFYVSNVTIEADTCPVVALYNSTRQPSPYFRQVLLSDSSTVPIIYTTLIAHTLNPYAESDGFDGNTHDFEMIVAEDGHGNDLDAVTYWFYLELE